MHIRVISLLHPYLNYRCQDEVTRPILFKGLEISNFVFFSQISMNINIHEYKNLKKAFPNHTWNI